MGRQTHSRTQSFCKEAEFLNCSRLEIGLPEALTGITRRITRHNMYMEVWYALAGREAIVLKHIHTGGAQLIHEDAAQALSFDVNLGYESIAKPRALSPRVHSARQGAHLARTAHD